MKSYRDVIESYRHRTKYKSSASDGNPCTRTTRGLLGRRTTVAGQPIHVGKESNRLRDVEAGLLHDWADIVSSYKNPERWASKIVPKLRALPPISSLKNWEYRGASFRAAQRTCSTVARTRKTITRAAVPTGLLRASSLTGKRAVILNRGPTLFGRDRRSLLSSQPVSCLPLAEAFRLAG